MTQTVAILGASTNPGRYAHRAQRLLARHGHVVIPVNPGLEEVAGVATVALEALPAGLDTVTVYLGAERLLPLVDALAERRPQRVILNPGADDPRVVEALRARGLTVQLDCTLILLDAGRFEAP
ncbi:MAG TPA: CoA-binding protein [Pseudomonadales bacterium]|nr:CoA-binding protein [Pseudomonadales bacterium]